LTYQPPASSTFLSEQISHQQPASSTFLSEQTSTSHQPPANRTGWDHRPDAEEIYQVPSLSLFFEKLPGSF
jgi:PKD repeat protein